MTTVNIPKNIHSRKQLYRGWCHRSLLFTAGHVTVFLFISMVDLIHTSGLVEASASTAYRPQSSGCGGVCWSGAWPNAVLVAGGPTAGWSPQCPTPWVAWIDGRGRQLLVGQCLSTAACLGERRRAATGRQSKASLYQLPQPLYGD